MGTNIFSRLLKRRAAKKPGPAEAGQDAVKGVVVSDQDLKNKKISKNAKENLEYVKGILGYNMDFVSREFRLGAGERDYAVLTYMQSLCDQAMLSENVLKPLMLEGRMAGLERPGVNTFETIEKTILTAAGIRTKIYNMQEVIDRMLHGGAAIFVDGREEALIAIFQEMPKRQVEKAEVEGVVRGPKESFTETVSMNIALIRQRLRSPNLVIEKSKLGRVTNTSIAIVYLKGVASPGLVQEVKRRIIRIDIDGILESGYIEELIQDDPYTPFPQIVYTERPDRATSALLQGRVCVFTDGTPMVLIMPSIFMDLLQSPEDYYERYLLATAIRLLRYVGLAIALLLPSFYIAVTTFHQEMIPTQLLISIAASRQGVPFPALVEALIMEVTFEALREAGLRLPRAVGQAVSIVGALVIGQAAVQAAIVSPLMVIVVALTGIASFMTPAYNLALSIRLIRFPLMFLAATLGLFGVMTGVLALLIHLAGLRSFGVPYLAPLAPLNVSDLKDSIPRAPWWAMRKRPLEMVKNNTFREAPGLKPHPPSGDGAGAAGKPVGGTEAGKQAAARSGAKGGANRGKEN